MLITITKKAKKLNLSEHFTERFRIITSFIITLWGNIAEKHIDRIQGSENYINKIITGSAFLRKKLALIYRKLYILLK